MKLEASNPTDPPPAFSSCSHMSLLDKPSINEAVENREVPRVLKTCVVSTAMYRIAQPTIPQRTSALLSKAISPFFFFPTLRPLSLHLSDTMISDQLSTRFEARIMFINRLFRFFILLSSSSSPGR
jgi:hypothetical protein